jgi:hypothetical protein
VERRFAVEQARLPAREVGRGVKLEGEGDGTGRVRAVVRPCWLLWLGERE